MRWSVGVLAWIALFACTSTKTTYVDEPIPESEAKDAGFDSRPSLDSGLGQLTFMPEKSFSGFDGMHVFKVPIAVYDAADDLEVTATKPSAVTISPTKLKNPVRNDGTADNGKYFLITVKEAGTITLRAKSAGRTTEATLTVASYASGRWAAGETRYKTGAGGDPPCTQCHVNGEAIDHSPAALATATDEKIATVITTGIGTTGFPIKIDGAPGHKWTVTDTEKDGLITYLRALDPKGFE
jgi:hypothetical protein